MLWKVDCLHCRQMVGGEKKRKEGKERKGGATQRKSVRRGQDKRRGWIWGQLCRLFWLLFDQERWVKMKLQKYSRSDFKIKKLLRSYLPVIWSWQWWLCELNELAAISWEGKKEGFACYACVWLYLQALPLISEHVTSSSLNLLNISLIRLICVGSIRCLVFLLLSFTVAPPWKVAGACRRGFVLIGVPVWKCV